jgi:4-amino-4-deoxy-L-arabinose transferase-like glycosyltransferase
VTATISAPGGATAPAAPVSRRRARLLGGDPVWARVGLLVLLVGTGVLYLWDLSASGWANEFYAAATQAGAQSWKAWFFGALDPGSVITVDKPPAALWLSGLSARVFGLSSWSLLAPQALCGVGAVGLLYGAVRRWSGPIAGLAAGAALALTPAAALMFRFDNPDALLTLLLVAGAYCVVRAVEAGRTSWLLLAGSALGFAFLTKMLQAFLVLPAFALVYLVAAPVALRRRIVQVLAAGAAVVVSAGWWVVAVALWPNAPYIGGSTDGTVLNLVFGYNGFGRLFGGDGNTGGGGGGPGGGQAGSSFGGPAGLSRLFSAEMGAEVSWLLPAALVALAGGLWVTRRRLRTDRTRAALLLWGGWALVTGLVFSYMTGIVHPYYTVALAPAVAALVAVGGQALWARRASFEARVLLALVVAAAGFWAVVLLGRNASWHPELRYAIALLTAVSAVGLLVASGRVLVSGLLATGLVAGLAGPAAYAVATAATPHTGAIPSVGPASAGGGFGGPGGGGGGPGGGTSSSALSTLLQSTTTKWAAATVGADSAASLQLASGKSVIAIGGFNGGDPAPTLAQFQQYVAAGQVSYYVAGGGGFGGGRGAGGSSAATEILAWVQANYPATTVGGSTVYHLTP